MKTYTTGQVAKICKITTTQARKLLDGNGVEIEFVESKYRRRSTRRIRLKNLINFMAEHKFSLDGFGVDDFDAQKAILCRGVAEFREAIDKAKKRGDIFLKACHSSDVLLDIPEQLGSLEDVRGIARNNSWAKVFRKMADVIEQHTRVCIANFKK